MAFFPIFLSVVFVVRNRSAQLEKIILDMATSIRPLVSDYELIIIDNASTDDSVFVLKKLTEENGLPNLQVYALTKGVDIDVASWVGLENTLGDFVAVIDPLTEDIHYLPHMLDKAMGGIDVVFAYNEQKSNPGVIYRWANAIFNRLYIYFNDIDLAKEAPMYRVLSKRVINFILQHPNPAIAYRYLPATGGFSRSNLTYAAEPQVVYKKHLSDGFDRALRLLVTTTRAPMRLVTSLSFFGAIANVLYSIYVVAVGFLKKNVAEGWISLSLQQSGMFFLISLVLLVLGEYILNMAKLSNEGPLYHIAQEFTSSRMTRCEKPNIEETAGLRHTKEKIVS